MHSLHSLTRQRSQSLPFGIVLHVVEEVLASAHVGQIARFEVRQIFNTRNVHRPVGDGRCSARAKLCCLLCRIESRPLAVNFYVVGKKVRGTLGVDVCPSVKFDSQGVRYSAVAELSASVVVSELKLN